MGERTFRRRSVLGAAASFVTEPVVAAYSGDQKTQRMTVIASPTSARRDETFDVNAFNMVGVFDIDWLVAPQFTRLLDNMAASPGAFGAIRFFGALNSGEREDVFPKSGGGVWKNPSDPIDFSITLRAIEALTTRGFVPFVCLNFFPPAVSSSPIRPPPSLERWQQLVRVFLQRCVERFGTAEVERWWFEVWNEPNMPPFWDATFDEYLELYRATSEAIVSSGFRVRLGGPAIAYLPDEGARLIKRFLEFLHREPEVRCDFISFHRKGIWTPQETRPLLQRSIDAARETAITALQTDPERFKNIYIINNEADMKVGFDTAFEPRMTEQFASWLVAQTVGYGELEETYIESGLRFRAASDNANQHLIRAPFDGRRSIMTRLAAETDLVKVPAYNFYELLRLIPYHRGTVEDPRSVYPHSPLYHLVAFDRDAVSCLFTIYPADGEGGAGEQHVNYRLRDLAWPRVNIAVFRIDADFSNAWTVARGAVAGTIDAGVAARIRQAQELAVMEPIRSNVAVQDGSLNWTFSMRDFSTLLLWITHVLPDVPAQPRWVQTDIEGNSVVLRWTPNVEPWFYSYELRRLSPGSGSRLVAPTPLRAAMWVDLPPPGTHRYELCAVSASGIRGELTTATVQIG